MFCFAKFCRLCLKDSSALINIFYGDKDNDRINDKIKFLRPELISPVDDLPPWVCLICRTQINRTFNLFQKWIKSREILQTYKYKFDATNTVPNNTILTVDLVNIKLENINIDNISVDNQILANDSGKYILKTVNTDRVEIKDENDEKADNDIKTSIITYTENDNYIENNLNTTPLIQDCSEEILSSNNILQSNESEVLDELLEIVKVTENIQIECFEKGNNNHTFNNNTVENTFPKNFHNLNVTNNFPNFNSININDSSLINNESTNSNTLENNQSSVITSNIYSTNISYSENLYCNNYFNNLQENNLHQNDQYYNHNLNTNCEYIPENFYNNTSYNTWKHDSYVNLNPSQHCVQISNANNTWHNYNEVFPIFDNVNRNISIQNQLCQNNMNLYDNNIVSFTENYSSNSNIINQYNIEDISANYEQNYYQKLDQYSPTVNKEFFSLSEDSNGNEIPSRKPKVNKKRNKIKNYKDNKFYQVFQDMEIASGHCNTPIEYILNIDNQQILYSVDRSKSIYSCKTCNINFTSICDILQHSSSIHNTLHDLKENEYLSINAVKPDKSVKMIVNHENKKFVCQKCEKNFSEVAALYRHVAVHVSNQRYFCDECGKSFPVYRYLSLHKLTHTRIRVYACKLCPKTFRAKDTLRTHEIVHHGSNQDKLHICDICGKGFIIEQYLKIHMKRHNKETGRICHICGKIQKNEELCYKHIKEKHFTLTLKECDICHKTFNSNRNLKAHMKLHGTRDYKCGTCEKEFFFKRDLENHYLLHTGIRPYICHECGKDFRSLGSLHKHIRTHTKIKSHVCKICNKEFRQLSSFQSHEKIHSITKTV